MVKEIKVEGKKYYIDFDEWEKLKKFYNIPFYGKESLS